MSEPDDRPADGSGVEPRNGSVPRADEAGGSTDVGAVDGAAAAGSAGSVGGGTADSVIPQEAPDPSIGPD